MNRNSNFSKSLRLAIITLYLAAMVIMGTACTQDDGRKAVENAVFQTTQVEQAITGHFCDADNVLSNCP